MKTTNLRVSSCQRLALALPLAILLAGGCGKEPPNTSNTKPQGGSGGTTTPQGGGGDTGGPASTPTGTPAGLATNPVLTAPVSVGTKPRGATVPLIRTPAVATNPVIR